MITERIAMWRPDGTIVSLRDILSLFDQNPWVWRITDFDGSGTFPSGATWAEFQDLVERGDAIFDWSGVTRFAQNLSQMTDGEIRALDKNGTPKATITALDSTSYELEIFDGSGIDDENFRRRTEMLKSER